MATLAERRPLAKIHFGGEIVSDDRGHMDYKGGERRLLQLSADFVSIFLILFY